MDSRIREIEQWVAEAKSDLGECGREAYLRKLFLLDAEIRAMLKDNAGILPEAVSPRLREKRVRRLTTPRLALAGVAGMLLLAASTVYLSQGGLLFASNPERSLEAGAQLASRPAATPEHVLTLPAGEILITDSWTPPSITGSEPQLDPLLLASAGPNPGQAAAVPPAGTLPAAPRPAGTPSQTPAATPGGSNQATSVMLASLTPRTPPSARNTPTGQGGASGFSFGGDGAIIARESRYPSEDEFRNSFTVNQTKDKAKQAMQSSGDGTLPAQITPEQPVDDVDNQESTTESDVDKLDPEALKQLLEKPFNR